MIADIFCIKSKVVLLFIAISLFSLQSPAFAQTGTIKGKVLDKTNNQSLAGAAVVVKGTTLGAAADLDGNYKIPNVPEGKYTLTVSYIGYVSTSVSLIVTAGKTLEHDFYLEPEAIQGQTVVVTAQAQGQLSAIQQQLASNKIANIVSEARIQELPDFNAAQALSRLPGVSTLQSSGEANKVVIRGLAPQYNRVSIDGISLASTGGTQIGVVSQTNVASNRLNTDRSVDLSMITPYMIKSIQVYKTLTPDMNANAIGGFVNMELREAPSNLHTDVLWQSGYTAKSNTYGNYRAVASASDRFFNDNLGAYALFNIESYDRNADNMNAGYSIPSNVIGSNGYEPVKVTNVTLDRHVETRKRYGGNLILDYRLPSGSIKSINMLSRLNSNYTDFQTSLNYSGKSLNFNIRQGDRNTDLAINTLQFQNDFGFMSADIRVSNTYSRNNEPNSPYFTFSQDQSFGQVSDNTIPEDLTHLVKYTGTGNTHLQTINLFSADYKENDQIYRGDFKIPLNLTSNVTGSFQFGGEYSYNLHKNDQSTPYADIHLGNGSINDSLINIIQKVGAANGHPLVFDATANRFPATSFTSSDSKLYDTFLDDQFGKMLWVCDPNILNPIATSISTIPILNGTNLGGWQNGIYQQLPNDYKYIEKYYAAYLMAEMNFGPDFMVVGGARYEEDRSLFAGFNLEDLRNPQQTQYFPVTAYPQNHYWLPMVQARYKLNDWSDIRYSYTQTLARPDYNQLSPHFSLDYTETQVYGGNPDLKPAQAYNHDIEISFHSNELGLLSIGAFYKTISKFTFATQYYLFDSTAYSIPGYKTINDFNPRPQSGATFYTYINSQSDAYVRGVELDFQTRFWYLPAPLNGVVLGINYTHILSSATYPYFDQRKVLNPDNPRRPLVVLFDSTRSGRLVDQPNDIFNTYIGYDYEGFSARVSFLFQGNSVNNIGNYPEQDGFTKNYFRLDASVKQTLPWDGVEVYLDVNNLNSESNSSAQQSIDGFNSIQNYGLTADLGARYRL
jgi:TonB-dependent receptor